MPRRPHKLTKIFEIEVSYAVYSYIITIKTPHRRYSAILEQIIDFTEASFEDDIPIELINRWAVPISVTKAVHDKLDKLRESFKTTRGIEVSYQHIVDEIFQRYIKKIKLNTRF